MSGILLFLKVTEYNTIIRPIKHSNVWKCYLGIEKGYASVARKNRAENVEMDDGNRGLRR